MIWLLADEGLKTRLGHFFEYDRAVKQIAESQRNVNVTILGHLDMDPAVAEELDAVPLFRYTNWDGIYDHAGRWSRYFGVLKHNMRMLKDLHTYVRRHDEIELVFAPAVVLQHLLGFFLFTLINYRRCGQVVLLIRNSIATYDEELQPGFQVTAIFWKLMFWCYSPLIRVNKVRFVTDSDQLSEEIALLARLQVDVVPHPSLIFQDRPVTQSSGRSGKGLRIFLPGPARFEKGADLLLEAGKILEEHAGRTITFVLQWENDFEGPDGSIHSLDVSASAQARVEYDIIRAPLSSEEYRAQLEAADIIALPYRSQAYFARISGVAVEALVLGKPVIYTRHTWIARQMERFDSGIATEENPLALVEAIDLAMEDFEGLSHRAESASVDARNYFSTESFLAGLLGESEEGNGNEALAGSCDLLYFLAVGEGGLVHYAANQIKALADKGLDVVVLGYKPLERQLNTLGTKIRFHELQEPSASDYRIIRAGNSIVSTMANAVKLRRQIRKTSPGYVLLGSFSEYWSPFWAWILKDVARKVPFGVVTHDPVRDFVLGPGWWHRWSIRLAYSLARDVFVHSENAGLQGTEAMPVVIPHGMYLYPESAVSRESVRASLGLPEGAYVLLSFGHIRDGKNLEVLIASLAEQEDVHLLVVGREQSSRDKQVAEYQEDARSVGVEQRCHFINEFVPDEEVGKYFSAADCLALIYSQEFRSASGVLNSNAQFHLPVIASGNDGPLSAAVNEYSLGVWLPTVSVRSVTKGLQQLRTERHSARWKDFETDHSWSKNAGIIMNIMTPPSS
jgi:glycosyltransferase involved in cell wall biosynthesis